MLKRKNYPKIMGILNVTPDSFSDGGCFTTKETIEQQIQRMLAADVDIIDVGGESTRPFAEAVTAEEELARVIPAIRTIRSLTDTPISIDSSKAVVARAALDAGADMVNDVSALRNDPGMIDVVCGYDGPVIIMHMQGTPKDMQTAPDYDDVVIEIKTFFTQRLRWMQEQGVAPERIVIDPGIGFGKTLEHNLTILRNIAAFQELGLAVLVGHSRKSFLEKLLALPVEERDPATAIFSALLAMAPVDILRVHDVVLTRQALRIAETIAEK